MGRRQHPDFGEPPEIRKFSFSWIKVAPETCYFPVKCHD